MYNENDPNSIKKPILFKIKNLHNGHNFANHAVTSEPSLEIIDNLSSHAQTFLMPIGPTAWNLKLQLDRLLNIDPNRVQSLRDLIRLIKTPTIRLIWD